MMKRRKIRHLLIKAYKAFALFKKKNPSTPGQVIPSAYYATLDLGDGPILLSMRPYFNWKQARRAARHIHHGAFICRGATLQRLLSTTKA